jgi:hypothetical protein
MRAVLVLAAFAAGLPVMEAPRDRIIRMFLLLYGVGGWPLAHESARAQTQADDALGFGESTAAPAQPDDDLGFGDAPGTPAKSSGDYGDAEEGNSSPWLLRGSLRAHAALRLERSGEDRVGALRQTTLASLEYRNAIASGLDFAAIASMRTEADYAQLMRTEAYDEATYDVYAWQVLPGESSLRLHTSSIELAVGNQIVNYGQGELLSVLDLVNPRDLREPMLSAPDELRMPRLMTQVKVDAAPFRIEAVVVHEAYFGIVPPPLGEFSPFRKLLEEQPMFSEALRGRAVKIRHDPARGLDPAATQFHARVVLSAHAIDVGLHAATLLEPLGVPGLPSPAEFARDPVRLPIYHPRYQLLGQSGAWTLGAFLVRWELALEFERPCSLRRSKSQVLQLSSERTNLLAGMLGVTWVPSTTTNAAVEAVQRVALQRPWESSSDALEPLYPIEAMQLGARFTQRFMRERGRLDLAFVVIGLAPLNAWSARIETAYALADGIELGLGAVTYHPSDRFGPLYGYERNDRVFCTLRWHFLI